MTDIKQLAKNLRRFNAWRRGAEGVEMPIMKDLGKWIEEAANALDCLTEPKPIKCETCEGAGKIDERLGGYHTSNANAQCHDCDGAGYLESIHDFRPGQWWVKELDGIQASQEATPDQKRAVAVVHNLLRHILKLELPGNVLAQRVEKLESELKHWKSNHAAEVQRARVLKERTDMPLERVQAYEQIGQLLAEQDDLAAELNALRDQDPLFWYRPVDDDGGYEGPMHNDSIIGKWIRDQRPGEWKELYARPVPAEPVNALLLDALKKCRDQFDHYVSHHINKGEFEKAASNGSFVMLANAAISEAEKQSAEAGG